MGGQIQQTKWRLTRVGFVWEIRSYDWVKQELLRVKVLDDGPILHFVASVGAVSINHWNTVIFADQ